MNRCWMQHFGTWAPIFTHVFVCMFNWLSCLNLWLLDRVRFWHIIWQIVSVLFSVIIASINCFCSCLLSSSLYYHHLHLPNKRQHRYCMYPLSFLAKTQTWVETGTLYNIFKWALPFYCQPGAEKRTYKHYLVRANIVLSNFISNTCVAAFISFRQQFL